MRLPPPIDILTPQACYSFLNRMQKEGVIRHTKIRYELTEPNQASLFTETYNGIVYSVDELKVYLAFTSEEELKQSKLFFFDKNNKELLSLLDLKANPDRIPGSNFLADFLHHCNAIRPFFGSDPIMDNPKQPPILSMLKQRQQLIHTYMPQSKQSLFQTRGLLFTTIHANTKSNLLLNTLSEMEDDDLNLLQNQRDYLANQDNQLITTLIDLFSKRLEEAREYAELASVFEDKEKHTALQNKVAACKANFDQERHIQRIQLLYNNLHLLVLFLVMVILPTAIAAAIGFSMATKFLVAQQLLNLVAANMALAVLTICVKACRPYLSNTYDNYKQKEINTANHIAELEALYQNAETRLKLATEFNRVKLTEADIWQAYATDPWETTFLEECNKLYTLPKTSTPIKASDPIAIPRKTTKNRGFFPPENKATRTQSTNPMPSPQFS